MTSTLELGRRRFLRSSLGLSGALLLGCDESTKNRLSAAHCDPACDCGGACPNDVAGSRVGSAPFINEGDAPLEVPYNAGLDGRLLTDLSRLTPENLVTPSSSFYIRTRQPDRLVVGARWPISVSGLVEAPSELLLDELLPLEQSQGALLLECSGNSRDGHFGLLSSAEWHGIPLRGVLDRLQIRAQATRVLISGFDDHSQPSARSTPGASWVFSFDELTSTGAFLATRLNGQPLPADHGAPVRLFVPGWYGCTCIKWVNEIVLVDDQAPATSQMTEFASRTHQNGTPALARDFQPAQMDQAAMPVRVEKWSADGGVSYRIVGILWGGTKPTDRLQIRCGEGDWQPVAVCPAQSSNRTWTLWSHPWRPATPGDYAIVLRVDDPSVRQRRLDSGYYLREVRIDEV